MNTGSGQAGAHGPSSLLNWWPAADPRHNATVAAAAAAAAAAATPSTSDVMSQLCRVCGEPAAGFHFGAFTCEGCKSFFGRTYNNLSSISECKNNGECVINKKNRTSCKACRLRKCLVVGMSKSGSRYGRRSNWFKIHCLLQEQQQHHHHHHHHHQQQQQQQQQQQRQLQQHPHHGHLQSAGLGAINLQHFQQQQQQPAAGGPSPPLPLPLTSLPPPPPPPPPPPQSSLQWADVKRHMRSDADNNNSVTGDLNKQPDGGRPLSVSAVAAAAAAAAVAAQAVRPEQLFRWPSPFFPAFPFPPPGPFFLQAIRPSAAVVVDEPARSTGSPASRSSCTDGGGGGGGGGDDDDDDSDSRAASPEHVVLSPVQETPMDLSVSSAVPPLPSPPPSPSRSSSPPGPCPARRLLDPLRRRRRRRRRQRQIGPSAADRRTSASESSDSADSTATAATAVAVGDGDGDDGCR